MTFIAIMATEPGGRVAKFRTFPTQPEAEAHVARFIGKFPDAFVVAEPAGPWSHWLIDVAMKTVTIDVPPALTSGNGTPTIGSKPQTIPALTNT